MGRVLYNIPHAFLSTNLKNKALEKNERQRILKNCKKNLGNVISEGKA